MSDSIHDSEDLVYIPLRNFSTPKAGGKYLTDNGREIATFWGCSFDVTAMKEPPKKKNRNSKVESSSPSSSLPAPQVGHLGDSNTQVPIRQAEFACAIASSGNSSCGNSETSPCDSFRVPKTSVVSSLYKYYLESEAVLQGGFFLPDGSIFETWNDNGYGERPSVCDRLPPALHFRNPEKIVNPWGPFCGYDGGTRAAYWGEWERDIVKYWLEAWRELVRVHKERMLEPVRFQVFEGGEDWSFRCAGNGERNTAGFPSFSQAPDLDIYCLERGGLKILIFPPELHEDPSLPDVVIFYGSEVFRNCVPASTVEKLAFEFLAQFGFFPHEELTKIRRIDIQITTNLYTVEDVRRAKFDNRIVCLANDRWDKERNSRTANGGKNCGSLYFGKRSSGACVLRVYDKQAELEDNRLQDRGKTQYYYYSCLGGENFVASFVLTRFEFELHKKIFDDFEVKSFEDFESKMPSIVDYLTNEWFRILETSKGNKHSDRQETAKLWRDISASFKSVAEFFASENKNVITVTRKTRENKVYTSRNWPKQVKTAVDFTKRGCAEMLLALGVEDPSLVNDDALELFVFPELRRVLDGIREYVRARGEGFSKSRSFVQFDPREFIKEAVENGCIRIPIEVFS